MPRFLPGLWILPPALGLTGPTDKAEGEAWLSSASKSDLLTTLPNLCLGCLRIKEEAHKCPNEFKEDGTLKYFCTI